MHITYPFFDFSFFEDKNKNLIIDLNIPQFYKIVYKHDSKNDCILTNYFNVIKNKNNNITIFYRKVPNKGYRKDNTNYKNEYTSILESKDGINFVKNKYKDKSNIIYNGRDGVSHNFFVLSNHFHLNEYLAIGGVYANDKIRKKKYVDGIYVLESKNNIEWKKSKLIITRENSLAQKYGTYYDSLNCIVYHNYHKKYYIYTRYNIIRNNRACQLFIYNNTDFNNSTKGINLQYEKKYKNIYAPNVMEYPNSKYFISTAIIQTDKNYTTQRSLLMISEDGICWKNLSDNWLKLNYQYYATPNIIKVNNEFYVYVNNIRNMQLELWKIQKDRLSCIKNNENNDKCLTSKKILLESNNIILNFQTFGTGYIKLNLLNVDKNILHTSDKLSGDHLDYNFKINYENISHIKYIQFILNNAKIYSTTLDILSE